MLKRIVATVALIAVGSLPLNMHTIQRVTVEPTASNATSNPQSGIKNSNVIASLTVFDLQPMQPLPLATLPYSTMDTYSNSYDVGQCTYGAASMKGDIPSDWGNANNWAYMAKLAGYTVNNIPIVGAVAETTAGWAGHVAVVTGLNADGTIQIEEMNYDGYGDGLYRSRPAAISEFVYIYI